MARTRRPTADTPSAGKRVLIAVGSVVIGLLVLCGLGVGLTVLGTTEVAVGEEDKTAIHTARDVARYRDFEVDPSGETWSAEVMIDGATELSYEYDDTAGASVFVSSSLHYEPEESDARIVATTVWEAARLGMLVEGSGIELEEVQGMLDVGESRVAYMNHQGERGGMLIVVRKSRHVYLLILGGVYFDDPELLREFLDPKLRDMESVRIEK